MARAPRWPGASRAAARDTPFLLNWISAEPAAELGGAGGAALGLDGVLAGAREEGEGEGEEEKEND